MPVTKTKFNGLEAVELTTSKLKLVGVNQFGPRIAFLGKGDGENLFLWEPEKYKRKDWDLRGGHRVWVTRPGSDESEETYFTDNEPAEVEILENGFRITAPEKATNFTRRGFEVKVLSDEILVIDNFLINTGDMLYSAGIWALTCTIPGPETQYVIPVGDGSNWDCFSMVFFHTWAGHNGIVDDPQITFKNDLLLIKPQGNENKRMLQAHKGIIALVDPARQVTFAKKVDFNPLAQYPMGCNMAFYIGPDNFMVEMETMGNEVTLKPGESAHNIETWILKSDAVNPDDVKNLF